MFDKINKVVAIIIMVICIPLIGISFLPSSSFSKERDYQMKWCESMSGVTEVVLPDRSRVDCVTEEYAVEVEFAHKWQEAIGQSLFYSIILEKLPGIALIVDESTDNKYIERLKIVSDKYNIRVWIIKLREE